MKKFLSMAVAGTALFAALGTGAIAHAATLNTDPRDYDTLRVGNYTVSPSSSSSNWTTSASASPGDTVNLGIYYHNTGTDTAHNVRVRVVSQSTGVGATQTFTAYVWADNASQKTGSATVTISSPQSVSYQNNVVWRPNQTTWGSQALPNGQSGSEIFTTGGLLLGDIAPGWSTQGNVLVAFLVSNNNTNTNTNSNVSATTQSATNITTSSATLNGSFTSNTSNTSTWFQWGSSATFGNETTHRTQGTSGSVSENISGLSQNTVYYYRTVAQGSDGVVAYGNTLSFVTMVNSGCSYNCTTNSNLPSVTTLSVNSTNDTFAILQGYVNPNNTSDTTRWFEWGYTTSLGFSTGKLAQGSSAGNFTDTISNLTANTTYYYRAVAQNSYGTVYGSVLSFTTTGGTTYYPPVVTAPTAVTTLATEVTSTSAKMNGIALINGNVSTTGWFEWGTTQNFGSQTSTATLGSASSITYSGYLTGLSSNTTYYYRAVAQNAYGTSRGATLSFTTSAGSVYQPPVVIQQPPQVITNTIVVGRGVISPIELSIVGGGDSVLSGQMVTYTIHYQNKGKVKLTNAALRVMLPAEMQFISGSRGNFTTKDNVLTVIIGDLNPGDSGDVTIQAQILPTTPIGKQLVTTVTLVYTDTSTNTQGDAIAYAVHTVGSSQVGLAASTLGFEGFFPGSLLGWFILLALIILIVFLIVSIQHARVRIDDSRTRIQ
ncbi:MAG: hypothetical protein ACYC8S_02045 [Minisyncoccota bacterium]